MQLMENSYPTAAEVPLIHKPIRIAILGTRGIPNLYGGFEQFAEYLSVGLVKRGHAVGVYLPHTHPYHEPTFHGVHLHRIYTPERALGPAAHFLYDHLSLRDAIKQGYEIALACGYGTSAPSFYLNRLKGLKVVTNMDGLEWKRTKWHPAVQTLTRWMEKLAVQRSHALVADNLGIQEDLWERYGAVSTYIPYGAEWILPTSEDALTEYEVTPRGYDLVIARLEPENNIELILDGHKIAGSPRPLLVVGNCQTAYGKALLLRYAHQHHIRFLGSLYDKSILDALRYHCRLYYHGHSVGGTNPSLLEAIGCEALIAIHENRFNRSVIGSLAPGFHQVQCVAELAVADLESIRVGCVGTQLATLKERFTWEGVILAYEQLFQKVLGRPN